MTVEIKHPGYSEGDKRYLSWLRDALRWAKENPEGHVLIKDHQWNGLFDKRITSAEFPSYAQEKIDASISRRSGQHHSRGNRDCAEHRVELRRDLIAAAAYRNGTPTQFPGINTKDGQRAFPEATEYYRSRQQDR